MFFLELRGDHWTSRSRPGYGFLDKNARDLPGVERMAIASTAGSAFSYVTAAGPLVPPAHRRRVLEHPELRVHRGRAVHGRRLRPRQLRRRDQRRHARPPVRRPPRRGQDRRARRRALQGGRSRARRAVPAHRAILRRLGAAHGPALGHLARRAPGRQDGHPARARRGRHPRDPGRVRVAPGSARPLGHELQDRERPPAEPARSGEGDAALRPDRDGGAGGRSCSGSSRRPR